MICRAFRVWGVAAAVLLSGAVMQSTVQAQMGSMDHAKSKAMDSMSAQSPADVYGKLLKGMSKEIIDAAEAMPADKYDFKPTNGQFDGVSSFADQVKHLAGANYGFFAAFGAGTPPERSKIAGLKSKDEIVQALKDSYDFADKSVATITAENAFMTVGSGQMKMTRAGATSFALAHSMDHYGQLVEYLRMNGIVPPASRKKS